MRQRVHGFDDMLGKLAEAHAYESATPLILNQVGGRRVKQERLGRLEEHDDGTIYDGVGYEPEQIPDYFRVPTAVDNRRMESFNRRIAQLQRERQAFLDEAWERAEPLSTETAQTAARKRKEALKE